MPAASDGQARTIPEVVHPTLPAFFISDLHLAAEQRETVSAFFELLKGPARSAGSLFILGDLFEYWAGDDDVDAPFNSSVCGALRELSAAGVEVFFMTGNRDLLAGRDFAHAASLQLLPDPTLVDLRGLRVLLSHGDMLCTDDRAYQAYRKQVRDPAWQAAFLAQPLSTRKAFIESLRQQSEAAKQDKPMTIMDVNVRAVEDLLHAYAHPVLIHGHTHRPAHHVHRVDDHDCARWVLSDWRGKASWLAFDDNEFTAHDGPPR